MLDALRTSGVDTISISRATDEETRRPLAAMCDVEELPTVGGRTVWPLATRTAVVEQPNHWGWATPEVPAGSIVVDHRHEADWDRRCTLARRLRKSLETLPSVVTACGFAAPWFVVLLPVAGAVAERRAIDQGVTGVTATAPDRPEFPGGIRVEVPFGADGDWLATCVASVAETVNSRMEDL